MTFGIQLTGDTYALLRRRSQEVGIDLDRLADTLLRAHLAPPHPYIEVVLTRSGPRAMVKGTRVAVSTIIGYIRLGESPESIARRVMPHLTLAQTYDALSYYHDHRAEIDAELAVNTESASQKRLRARLGEANFRRLTGRA